jgi:methionyl aminopeptidase
VTRLRSNDRCWCGSGKKLKRCHGDHASFRRPARRRGEVSPPRPVPDGIARPPYLVSGAPPAGGGLQILAGDDLERMRHACQVAAEVLLETGAAVAPGVTTDELDAVAHQAYLARGAYPSTLGYRGYPKSICTSVNEVVCHGIPDDQPLREGDVVNVDVTAYVEGMHGDTSATFVVGDPVGLDEPTAGLVAATRDATLAGIAAVAPGRSHREIGRVIEPLAEGRGLGVVRDYGGHGIGSVFHAAPHISHVEEAVGGVALVPGMTFTVEPMLTAGTHRHVRWPDGWTEVTEDLLPSAQFEHTVTVTDDGVEVLTVTAGGDTAVAWPNAGRSALRPA